MGKMDTALVRNMSAVWPLTDGLKICPLVWKVSPLLHSTEYPTTEERNSSS